MELNYLTFFLVAIIPLVLRELWYNDQVFGVALAKANGLSAQPPRKMNRILEVALTYLLGLLLAFFLSGMVIHQSGVMSLFATMPEFQDPNSEVSLYVANFMEAYGDRHRSFGHGTLHGVLTGLLFVTPIFSLLAFTEKKRFKYIAIHGGFWIVCFAIMGGLICAYG